MKLIITLIVSIISYIASSAAVPVWSSLEVVLRDEESLTINLSETLAMQLRGEDIVISDRNVRYEFSRGDILSFRHVKSPYNSQLSTGVDEVGSEEMVKPSIYLCGEYIGFSAFPVGTIGCIYDISGREVLSILLDEDYLLPLSSLDAGCYAVSAQGVSIKIILK